MDHLIQQVPLYILVPVAAILTLIISFVVIKALYEGREISFWPPRIGARTITEEPSGAGKATMKPKTDHCVSLQETILQHPPSQLHGVLEQSVDKPNHTTADESFSAPSPPSVSLPTAPIGLLHFTSGTLNGRCFFVTEGQRTITVGRANDQCDIAIPDGLLTRMHFRINVVPIDSGGSRRRSYEVTLIDSGSANGTFVNGQRISHTQLADQDVIQAGGTTIKYHYLYK